MINFHITFDFSLFEKDPVFSFPKRPSKIIIKKNDSYEFFSWGDPIIENKFFELLLTRKNPQFIAKAISGHYYYILLDKISRRLIFANSIFSILPAYYCLTDNIFEISNDPTLLKIPSKDNFDSRFILENILFNYPLFNHSVIKDVLLLPTNHYIEIKNKRFEVLSHTSIHELFSDSPSSSRSSVTEVAEVFIDNAKKYFPDSGFCNALTGGFDGRTLVATGLFYKKDFTTYSFGCKNAEDISIAKKLSAIADLQYFQIELNESYKNQYSLSNGLDFIKGSNGSGSFARAHYLFAAKSIASQTDFLITGNFGSEIFRAANNPGALISQCLYKLYASENYDEAINSIQHSLEWKWIIKDSFKNDWDSLKEDIRTLPAFNSSYKNLSRNQLFYITIFNEVFRKYFGAEMANQFQYIANRTPFLDYNFLAYLFKTKFSGVNSDFFTHNPLKRIKGQIAYAEIIKRTYLPFVYVLTDKGYRPIDLLNLLGNIKISSSYFKKLIFKNNELVNDPYSVKDSFLCNKPFWSNIILDNYFFNKKNILKGISDFPNNYSSLFIALSQAWYYNYLSNNEKK